MEYSTSTALMSGISHVRTIVFSALLGFGAACATAAPEQSEAALERLRIDQIQVVGTHNSYQQPIDSRVIPLILPRLQAYFDIMLANQTPEQRKVLIEEHPTVLNGADLLAAGFDYIQMPIEAQLDAGVRSIELDLQADPEGGLFADPLAYRELRAAGQEDLAPFNEAEMRKPGTKVFHLADVDFRSQCPRFRQCLTLLRKWSDAHPGHSPIFVLLEPKLSGLDKVVPGAAKIAPFDKAAFASVDEDILSIIGRDRLFMPDDLRGKHATLEAAVLAHAWPTVAATRGKFIFTMLVPGMNLNAFAPYLDGRASLEGRVAFVQGKPGMAHAAFVMVDNVMARPGEVAMLARKGYLLKSRADIDTWEARHNDGARREATMSAGAQIISTDYPFAPNIYGNDYQVRPFTGGFRCNPVNANCPVPDLLQQAAREKQK